TASKPDEADDDDTAGEETSDHSDEDGRFTLEVSPGDYTLTAYRGDEEVVEVIEPITLAPGERIDGLELHLAAGSAIEGRALADGFELSGPIELCARIHKDDTSCIGAATSDEDGTFTVKGLPRRTLWLRASTDETEL